MMKTRRNITVVIPTIREKACKEFLKAWQKTFAELGITEVIVVEDNPTRTFKMPEKYCVPIRHISWKEIDEKLGDSSWIIPRRTDCIRSFGFLAARYFENILTLDDDVRPTTGFTNRLIYSIEKELEAPQSYYDYGQNIIAPRKLYMRGFPFSQRNVTKTRSIIYGGWDKVPDVDGITQLSLSSSDYCACRRYDEVVIPKYQATTGCIMNAYISWQAIPIMYQLLMGKDHGYDRWGDIWSCLFAKRVLDLHDMSMGHGDFIVEHTRMSNTYTNIVKESTGYTINEVLWDKLLKFDKKGVTIEETYINLAEFVAKTNLFDDQQYSDKLSKAMKEWQSVVFLWK